MRHKHSYNLRLQRACVSVVYWLTPLFSNLEMMVRYPVANRQRNFHRVSRVPPLRGRQGTDSTQENACIVSTKCKSFLVQWCLCLICLHRSEAAFGIKIDIFPDFVAAKFNYMISLNPEKVIYDVRGPDIPGSLHLVSNMGGCEGWGRGGIQWQKLKVFFNCRL